MVSETNKNSQDQALEERLANMHEQMAGVTSRLDQTERALDLDLSTRDVVEKFSERLYGYISVTHKKQKIYRINDNRTIIF